MGYAGLLPKQEAEDSLFEYISKASQFNKKPIDFYDCRGVLDIIFSPFFFIFKISLNT